MVSNLKVLEREREAAAVSERPDRAEVEDAFRTIIRWTGDDPARDGLIETPSRVARAFEEFFIGYSQNPVTVLQKTFEEIEGYDEMITLRGVRFESHCEHHMAPIVGKAWVLHSERSRRRHQQARPRGRDLRQAPADSGEDDGTDRQYHQ